MLYLSKEEILTPQEGKENGSIFIHTDIKKGVPSAVGFPHYAGSGEGLSTHTSHLKMSAYA